MISLEEGVGKMRAALAAREDKSLTIIGRTSAPSITGLADGIKRLKAYEAEGVDALFIAGGLTRHDLDSIAEEIKIPLMLGGVPPTCRTRITWPAEAFGSRCKATNRSPPR